MVIARTPARRVTFFVAQMLGELDIQSSVEHPLGQPRQQPLWAQQPGLLSIGPIQQLVSQPINTVCVDLGADVLLEP
jgi:hypothetical protein